MLTFLLNSVSVETHSCPPYMHTNTYMYIKLYSEASNYCCKVCLWLTSVQEKQTAERVQVVEVMQERRTSCVVVAAIMSGVGTFWSPGSGAQLYASSFSFSVSAALQAAAVRAVLGLKGLQEPTQPVEPNVLVMFNFQHHFLPFAV